MFDISHFNTLKVRASANHFLEINSIPDLKKLPTSEPILFLGLGANILFTKDFPGTVAKVNLSCIQVISETDSDVIVEATAGQNWHEFVMWSVDHNFSGIENMALIPSTVGGAIVGNIAAYGQNQADVVDSIEIFDLATSKITRLSQSDCRFFYRDSIFKNQFKDKFFIVSARYKLSKTAHFDTSYHSRYESLEKVLSQFAKPPYSIRQVADAVIKIRYQKMPDWTKIGTAGSFFKNPFVTKSVFQDLSSRIKDLQWYPTEKMQYPHPDDPIFKRNDQVKIPAGRLLDELGWRGKTIGRVSTFDKHALVVINLGGASGKEIYDYTQSMHADILKNFGVSMDYEVNII